MSKSIIALDADGVLLDYSTAYSKAWERAFGSFPHEVNPEAYWPMDRWDVQRLTGSHLDRLRACFDEEFWSSIAAVLGAQTACDQLVSSGFELVCVTALPERFAAARTRNLHSLGFPIERVIATDNESTQRSPKANALAALKPVAFVDDYAPYLLGVDPAIHRALVMRGPHGTPNQGEHLQLADSQHADLLEFSVWWTQSWSGVADARRGVEPTRHRLVTAQPTSPALTPRRPRQAALTSNHESSQTSPHGAISVIAANSRVEGSWRAGWSPGPAWALVC